MRSSHSALSRTITAPNHHQLDQRIVGLSGSAMKQARQQRLAATRLATDQHGRRLRGVLLHLASQGARLAAVANKLSHLAFRQTPLQTGARTRLTQRLMQTVQPLWQ